MSVSFSRVQIREMLNGVVAAEIAVLDGVTPGTIAANKAVVVDANKDASSFRNVTATGTVTAGTVANTAINVPQSARTSAAVTKNSSDTYENVTGLSVTVVPGTYKFKLVLPSTVANGTGGIKYCFKYTTAALSALTSTARGYTASAVAVQNVTSTTDQADLFSQAAVVISVEIEGTMVVTTGGTIAVQVAQAASHASNTVALIGGSAEFIRIA